MSISPQDHLEQTDHIEHETISSPSTTQHKLASVATFLLSLLAGFGKMLRFPFLKLYDFINKKQESIEEEQNSETPNTDSSMQADTDEISSSPVHTHEDQYSHTSNSEKQNRSYSSEKIKEDTTKKPTRNASLKHNAAANNMCPNTSSQAPVPSSPLLINGQNIENIFADSADASLLSTTKMLMDHILSKDQLTPRPDFNTTMSSYWTIDLPQHPVITKFLSQYAPSPITIPSNPKCGVPIELLHDIQRLNAMPSEEENERVKASIVQTANKMLHELQTSQEFAYIRQAKATTSSPSFDAIRSLLINKASLEDIKFGSVLCSWQKPPSLNPSEHNDVPQHVYDIYRLSEIYLSLASRPYLYGLTTAVSIETSNYHPDLFYDKQVCAQALAHTAQAMKAYAAAFTSDITRAHITVMAYMRQSNINAELSKMVSGDREYINPQRPEIQHLFQGSAKLKSITLQRCFTQYPDSMCQLISHMLSGASQDQLSIDMNEIFQTMSEAKYGIKKPTDEQTKEIINEIKRAFHRCTRDMKILLVMQHKEQALQHGVPQDKIQQFLDADELVPELLDPPIHLIQHNK